MGKARQVHGSASSSALDALKARRDATRKQRPVEAERQRDVAALDHRIGLFGATCRTSDRNTAFEDAGFGLGDQRQHFGIVGAAALADRGGEIAGPITATSMPGTAMISSMRLTASTCSMVIMQIMSSSAVAM